MSPFFFFFNTRQKLIFQDRERAPEKDTKTDWLTDLSLIGFGSGREFDVEKDKEERPAFSLPGLSKLDQTAQRGCNYDQPAGAPCQTGWAATREAQLLTCNKNGGNNNKKKKPRRQNAATDKYVPIQQLIVWVGGKTVADNFNNKAEKCWCLRCLCLQCNTFNSEAIMRLM